MLNNNDCHHNADKDEQRRHHILNSNDHKHSTGSCEGGGWSLLRLRQIAHPQNLSGGPVGAHVSHRLLEVGCLEAARHNQKCVRAGRMEHESGTQ